jgi:hypothetical protein
MENTPTEEVSMSRISAGKLLLSATSLWSAVGSYRFDWNETHIHNPDWPPHAKFHNAQTMSTGAALGAIGLYSLWGGPWTRGRLQVSAGAASLYWITQLSAVLYPGTALFDHARTGDDGVPPRFRGPQTVVASIALAANTVAYVLERRRLE